MSDETPQHPEPEYQQPLQDAPALGNLTVRARFGIAVGATLPATVLLVLLFCQLILAELIYWWWK